MAVEANKIPGPKVLKKFFKKKLNNISFCRYFLLKICKEITFSKNLTDFPVNLTQKGGFLPKITAE
jgi:hypothetical protein